ncbi:MAG: hypothetical protein AAFQ53_15635, partial [Bacteroidota bacterium]
MPWTDLLVQPEAVNSLYQTAPALDAFALEELTLTGGTITIRGYLSAMPNPLPTRWQAKGYTKALARCTATGIDEATLHGIPRFLFDARGCLEGDSVDLDLSSSERNWTTRDGREQPYLVISGTSSFLDFRFVHTDMPT